MAGAVAASVAAASLAAIPALAADDSVNFKAGLIFQTNAWTFRNNISQSEAIWWDPDFGDAMHYDVWNVGDVDITGDGTYMVYFEKNVMDDCKDGPETYWNFLKLQTNIPLADYMETNADGEDVPTVDIKVEKLVIDGKEVAGATDATVGNENLGVDDYSDGCNGITDTVVNAYMLGFANTWNADQTVIDATASFGGRVMLVFTVTGLGGSGGNYTEGDEPAWGAGGNAGGSSAGGSSSAGTANVAVDMSKLLWGDPEGKGNLRIELFNAYGSTTTGEAYDPAVSPVNPADIAGATSVSVTFTLSGAPSGDYTATLGFADGSWAAQDWESSIPVSGDGTYTITSNFAPWQDEETGEDIPAEANGIMVFVIDIKEMGADAGIETSDDVPYQMDIITVSDVSVEIALAAGPEEAPADDGGDEAPAEDNTPSGDTEESTTTTTTTTAVEYSAEGSNATLFIILGIAAAVIVVVVVVVIVIKKKK